MRPHPWDLNEHGMWCMACGHHVAAIWQVDSDGFEPPESCRQCGYPDFEDGMGYFADEEE